MRPNLEHIKTYYQTVAAIEQRKMYSELENVFRKTFSLNKNYDVPQRNLFQSHLKLHLETELTALANSYSPGFSVTIEDQLNLDYDAVLTPVTRGNTIYRFVLAVKFDNRKILQSFDSFLVTGKLDDYVQQLITSLTHEIVHLVQINRRPKSTTLDQHTKYQNKMDIPGLTPSVDPLLPNAIGDSTDNSPNYLGKSTEIDSFASSCANEVIYAAEQSNKKPAALLDWYFKNPEKLSPTSTLARYWTHVRSQPDSLEAWHKFCTRVFRYINQHHSRARSMNLTSIPVRPLP